MQVKASDVLDTNAAITRPFVGKIVGQFRRMGPNRWDDYELIREDLGSIDVFPGVRVQLATRGPEFRMRAKGKVLLVRWTPDAELAEAHPELHGPALRNYFVQQYCESSRDDPGIGEAAVLASKLGD